MFCFMYISPKTDCCVGSFSGAKYLITTCHKFTVLFRPFPPWIDYQVDTTTFKFWHLFINYSREMVTFSFPFRLRLLGGPPGEEKETLDPHLQTIEQTIEYIHHWLIRHANAAVPLYKLSEAHHQHYYLVSRCQAYGWIILRMHSSFLLHLFSLSLSPPLLLMCSAAT